MYKEDKYSLGYAIGSSIQENKDKIAKLENQNKKLKEKVKIKDMIIDEILENSFFTGDCPYSSTGYDYVKNLCDCENCQDTYKKCWGKFFKNEVLERGKNENNK